MNNLNNLSDDELDKLFRQSAEESNVEFDEGAWQKMNSLLDKKQPTPTNWRKYSLIILAILFLGSTAVYFGNENGLFNKFQNEKSGNSNLGTSNLGTGKLGTDNLETEELGTADLGTGNLETEELGTADLGTGNLETEELGTADLGTGNLETEELGIGGKEINKSASSSENIKASTTKKDKINIADNSTKTKNITENNNLSNKTEKAGEIENGNLRITAIQPIDVTTNKNNKKSDIKSNKKIPTNNGFKNENLTENKVGLLENKNSEISKNDKKVNSKTKASKPQNIKDNSVLANIVGLKNNDSAKNKTDNKVSNLADNQSNTTSNEVLETAIEKTYFQNISLDYLFAKTGYNYQKPKFEVEVSPSKPNLPEPKKIEYYKKGLAVRVGISPDISTISSNKVSKIGSNFGAFLEYRFSKKLSIQAGVVRSMKYYDAMPDQYTWVWGYSHDKLVDVAATCKMMDYPINIRYDVLSKEKTKIFVGAGATTYKMMNEKYIYNYKDNASPTIKHRYWAGKTGTYYTSNLNLSIGLEKYLTNSITIQAEPFVKSPIKSIGFGKVPLITYGMMFSAKYPLNNLIRK